MRYRKRRARRRFDFARYRGLPKKATRTGGWKGLAPSRKLSGSKRIRDWYHEGLSKRLRAAAPGTLRQRRNKRAHDPLGDYIDLRRIDMDDWEL